MKSLEQTQKEQLNNLDVKLTGQVDKLEQEVKEEFTQLDEKIVGQGNTTSKKIEDLANMFEGELKDKFTKINEKLDENFKTLNLGIENKFKDINQKLDENVNNLEEKIRTLLDRIKKGEDDFSSKLKIFTEEIEVKEEVLRDMLKKFEADNIEFKNSLKPVLGTLKSQQDLVKITLDVQKKQIHDSAKEWINDEIKLACKNKEREILMNLWIDEMKEIIDNLDKLKEIHPKELKLHINEISSTIGSFKQKYIK